jgi:NTP pyrophosphatase (non-canonical NTP hydrolase)
MEIADVLVYLCDFANCMDIDLSLALDKKLKKIDKKYRAEKILQHGDEFYY